MAVGAGQRTGQAVIPDEAWMSGLEGSASVYCVGDLATWRPEVGQAEGEGRSKELDYVQTDAA